MHSLGFQGLTFHDHPHRLRGLKLCLSFTPVPLCDSDILYLTPCCQYATDDAPPPQPKQCSHHLSDCPFCLRLQEEPSDGVRDRCLSGTMHLLCIHVCARPRCVRLIEMDACTSEHSEKVSARDR